MELTIIIPIYNVEPYLPKCLGSIATQLGNEVNGRVEVILVDDGSTDGSGEIADGYADAYSCMRVIHKKNMGVAAARNTGMEAAAGGWLYFMDSDDWMAQDGVSLLLRAVGAHPRADMILLDGWRNTGEREFVWEHFERETLWERQEELQKLQRGVLYYPMDFPQMKAPLAAPWDKLYRRDFLAENRIEFREGLSVLDDMVFNMEVLGEAERAAYKKYKICHYRQVSDSITNRFRADRVEQDREVWKLIAAYRRAQFGERGKPELAETGQARQAFEQACFGRVIRSFAICCRLCFYHKDNKKSYKEKQKHVRAVAGSDPYRQAFLRIHRQNLEWKLRVVVFLMRYDLYGGLYLLHLGEKCLRTLRDRG